MSNRRSLRSLVIIIFWGPVICECGSSQPPPQASQQEEDFDLVGSIVGDVEVEQEGDEQAVEEYKGPTSFTVNLRVVNDKNPEGSFRLIDAEGKIIIDKGKLGEPKELNQGTYSLEFISPLVFNSPTYLVENINISGKEMTHDETFPAGQITIFTFYPKKPDKCVPVPFKARDISSAGRKQLNGERDSKPEGDELAGEGNTCQPVILEAGNYELDLKVSKNKIQPVRITVNSEQVSQARIELEK
jgi:hypothetical protein